MAAAKNDIVIDGYSLQDRVQVIDPNSEFYNLRGNIIRFGTAGYIEYLHVALDGVQTPFTFVLRQVEKEVE